MTSTKTRKLALLTARVMIAAGLAAGASIGMAAIAVADTAHRGREAYNCCSAWLMFATSSAESITSER